MSKGSLGTTPEAVAQLLLNLSMSGSQKNEGQDESQSSSQTHTLSLVIIHPFCIKHKYSRQGSARGTIVERPERSKAAFLAIAAAQALALVECRKSSRLGEFTDNPVTLVHGEWPAKLEKLCDSAKELLESGKCELDEEKYHTGDLYLAAESKEALKACIGALYDGIDALYSSHDRVHINVRPPGHHCSSLHPSGFCLINNIMIAAAYAVENYGVTRVAILDFDLHHGDGTQEIVYRLNESQSQVKYAYFSLHDIQSFPCESGDREKIVNASMCLDGHGQYIWNVHLESCKLPHEFDIVYREKYSTLFSHAHKFLTRSSGKTLVMLSAGFDASEYETRAMQRHSTNVPTVFFEKFTRDSVVLAQKTNSKLVSVMEGGYSDRAIISGLYSHLCGLSNHNSSSLQLGLLERILKNPDKVKDTFALAVSSIFKELWQVKTSPGKQLRGRKVDLVSGIERLKIDKDNM